jgi:hypothetical protein
MAKGRSTSDFSTIARFDRVYDRPRPLAGFFRAAKDKGGAKELTSSMFKLFF